MSDSIPLFISPSVFTSTTRLITTPSAINPLPLPEKRLTSTPSIRCSIHSETALSVLHACLDQGVVHQYAAPNTRSTGRNLTISDTALLNFGSCSYLALETHPHLIKCAQQAVAQQGTLTASSRTYLSNSLYSTLDNLFASIFQTPHVIVAPTTTLGHLSTLPVLVGKNDAVVLDQQVHASVQMTARLLSSNGTHVEVVPHHNLPRLEARVTTLEKKYEKVWYMADGVYSMSGDSVPMPALLSMLKNHTSLHLYIDDAHGMSWTGARGSGSVVNHLSEGWHPRLIVAAGLGKGFGTGGCCLVFGDAKDKECVQLLGITHMFSGPLQPAVLGAAIASAEIHLSSDIDDLQQRLQKRITYCQDELTRAGLPFLGDMSTPVGFVPTGLPEACTQTSHDLQYKEGIFVNTAQYPATPMKRGGTRFLITCHHEMEDIDKLVAALSKHWEKNVQASGLSTDDIYRLFKIAQPVS